MNIYAEEGAKVVAWNTTSGYDSDKEKFQKYLTKGEVYTVDYTEVGGWITGVYLKEFPDVRFNSVQFEDFIGLEEVEEEFGGDTMSDVIDKAVIVEESKDHFFEKGEVVEFVRRHAKSGSYVFRNAGGREQYLLPSEFEWVLKG